MGFQLASANYIYNVLFNKCAFSGKTAETFGITTCTLATTVYKAYVPKPLGISISSCISGQKGDCEGKVLYDLSCAQADYISNFSLKITTPIIRVKNSVIKRIEFDGYIEFKVTFILDGITQVRYLLATNKGDAKQKTEIVFPNAVFVDIEAVSIRTPRYRVCWSKDLGEHLIDLTRIFNCDDGYNYVLRKGFGHLNHMYLLYGDENSKEQSEQYSEYPDLCVTSAISTEIGFENCLRKENLVVDLKLGASDEGHTFPKLLICGCPKLEVSFIPFGRFLIIQEEDILSEVIGDTNNVVIVDNDDISNNILGKILDITYANTFTTLSRDLTQSECETLNHFIDVQTFISSSVCPPSLHIRANTSTPSENTALVSFGSGTTGISNMYMATNIHTINTCGAVCPGQIVCIPNVIQDICPDQSVRAIMITAKRLTDIAQGDFGYEDSDEDNLLEYAHVIVCGQSHYSDDVVTKIHTMNDLHRPQHLNYILISLVNDLDNKHDTYGSWPISCICKSLCNLPLYIKIRDKSEIGSIPVVINVSVLTNNITSFPTLI